MLVAGIAVVVSVRGLLKATPAFNNFDIFRHAFGHLIAGTDLYALDLQKHVDYFKYSPMFALLMAPFYLLPRPLGLIIWNLANALAPCAAVRALRLEARKAALVVLFALPELTISIQNAQSNGLVLGAMLGAFAALERRRAGLAALLLALGCVIKPFVIVMAVCMVFSPEKRRFATRLGIALAALALLPGLILGPRGLMAAYEGWFGRLAHDLPNRFNISFMSFVRNNFGLTLAPYAYLPLATIFLLSPLLRRSLWQSPSFRLGIAASVLMWVVLFNHKSESPTYVIAAFGVGLWAMAARPSWWRLSLALAYVLLGELASTDLVPRSIRQGTLQPFQLKVLPLIGVWVVHSIALTCGRHSRSRESDDCASSAFPGSFRCSRILERVNGFGRG